MMDAQQFLAEFGHIANAPGGIGKLRELILELAIKGQLLTTPDSATDARTLLSEITSFRVELVHAGKLRRPTPQPEIEDSELSFSLPTNWAFERLGNVCEIVRGVTFPSSKKQTIRASGVVACLRTSNVQAEVDWDDLIFIDEELVGREDQWVQKGDTIISMANSYELVGKVALVREVKERATFGGFIAAVRPHVLEPDYLYLVLRSPYMQARMRVTASQTTNIANISLGGMRPIPTPIPPKEEQSRIVAKVDELMSLCDKLEAQQQARRKLQNNLRQSTLQAVASAASPHDLQATWTRLADNFGQLFHAPEDVDDLRKAVLDLAVSGYLSSHDKIDESASVLKEKILAAKHRGIGDGTFSRKKHVKPEELAETTLPNHWTSITLDEAISTIDAGWSPACLPSARDDENKWGILKTTAVQVLRFLPHEHKELPASLDPRPQYQIEVGDILITRAGPKNRVGICCVVNTAPPKLMISDKLIRFHIVDDLINPRFVALCLSAGEPGRIVERLKSGMADSQMNISQDKLRAITIPLPPREEQLRILTKIETFMKIVDIYSNGLRKGERIAEQIAAVAISALTGIAIEQEEEPMKAPQTELIAPLRLGTTPGIKDQAPLATILARHNGEASAKDLWQRFGGEIDAFYAQLKTEVAHGWILEPAPAEVREKSADVVSA